MSGIPQAPPYRPSPYRPSQRKKGMSTGAKIGIAVVVYVIIGIIVYFAFSNGSDETSKHTPIVSTDSSGNTVVIPVTEDSDGNIVAVSVDPPSRSILDAYIAKPRYTYHDEEILRKFSTADPESCANECYGDSACLGFSMTPDECYLRKSLDRGGSHGSHNSWIKRT